MRFVLDTGVLVAALRSDSGASRQLLESVLSCRIEMAVSVPLMVEYEAVLKRPEHLAVSGLTVQDIDEVINALAAIAAPVRLRFLWRPQLVDPGDEMVLETAVNGGASRLVTFNMRHLEEVAKRFGIRAMLPRDAWKEIR